MPRGRGSAGSPDVNVEGGEQLALLASAMRRAGQGGLLKEAEKSLRQAIKPVTPKTRTVARTRLPQSGGLATRVARAPQRTTARAGNTTTSLRVTVAGKRSGAYGADQGAVRHPVFGNRRAFAVTKVRPGWFTDTVEDEREAMQRAVVAVLDAYTKELLQRVRRQG